MLTVRHRSNDLREGGELHLLWTEQRLSFKEGDDSQQQVLPPSNHEHQRGVRTSPVILLYPSAVQALPKEIEHHTALNTLTDLKLGHDLDTQFRARVPLDGYMKTAFSIDETS